MNGLPSDHHHKSLTKRTTYLETIGLFTGNSETQCVSLENVSEVV